MLDSVANDLNDKPKDATGESTVSRNGPAASAPVARAAEAAPKSDPAPPPSVAPNSAPAVPATAAKRSKKPFILAFLAVAVIGAGAYYGHGYWTEGRFMVSTDDAYIGADMAVVSPKIQGYVASVPVKENDVVKAGQPIVVIDDGDYRLALETAVAKIDTQRAAFARLAAQRDAALADVGQADANRSAAEVDLAQAALTLSRASDLVKSGAGTVAQRDNAQSLRDSAAAKVAGMDAAIVAAKANVTVLEAEGKEAERTLRELEIARDQAARDLSFTTLKAPYDGVVGNLSVQTGDLVSAGRRLAAVVPMSTVYIDANFKETQLAEIVPGQKAHIEIDALPGRDIQGTVVSLSPASGSVFSLLPSDNATGNFTKVVQRVPVRIAFDDAAALGGRLRPGLSAVVSVDMRTGGEAARKAAEDGNGGAATPVSSVPAAN